MRRRALLAASTAALAPLAGCGTDGTGEGPERAGSTTVTPTSPDDSGPTATEDGDDGEPLSEAVIATDLAAQPRLGPDPRTAESVIVDVSDPSSRICGSHHSGAFQRIRSELVAGGSTAYVVRTVGWASDWGPDACRVLEETVARNPDRYWGLLEFFFDEQRSISTENVLAAAAEYLDAEGVDGAAVIETVEAGGADDAVATDERIARAAGVRSVPTFFCFRDGRLRTTLSGQQRFGDFEGALGY